MRRAMFFFPLYLVLTVCAASAQEADDARPVITEIIGLQADALTSFIGNVSARTETDLGFPVAGTLKARPVQVGDVVETGALLGQIDPADLDADVRAAEAGVTVAMAQLNTARNAAERVDLLVSRGVDSVARAQAATASLVAAEAAMTQARAELRQAEEVRGYAELTAPHGGIVTHVFAEPGSELTAGQPVVRVATTGEREVILDLSDRDAARLTPGAEFRVWLEAAPQVSAKARLRLIEPVSDSATRTRRLHLTLPEESPDAFRLGALVRAELSVGAEQKIKLPESSILIGETTTVWVVDGSERRVTSVPVTLGEKEGDRVVITSGLTEGQEVIVKGVNSIEDGQHVGPRVRK